jgi:hypothetical protein
MPTPPILFSVTWIGDAKQSTFIYTNKKEEQGVTIYYSDRPMSEISTIYGDTINVQNKGGIYMICYKHNYDHRIITILPTLVFDNDKPFITYPDLSGGKVVRKSRKNK